MVTPNRQVVFAMEWMPAYRVAFYEQLRASLGGAGIKMMLVHGDAPPNRKGRRDQMTLEWATLVPNRFFRLKGVDITHQPVGRLLKHQDLVILQQEAGLTLNYRALGRSRLGGPTVALWGHGENPNPNTANPWAERVKAACTRQAGWVFAYTERSRSVFERLGVSPERITVVQNSADPQTLAVNGATNQSQDIVSSQIRELIAGLKQRRARVAWIVSALDEWKRVPFLLDVLDAVRHGEPAFEFLVLGAGSHSNILEQARGTRPWLHLVGPRFGADKSALGQVAELTIHPGLAGLHVVDSFASGTPMITQNIGFHSHEIDYLDPGVDSLVLGRDISAGDYAQTIVELFRSPDRLASLQQAARRAAEIYSLDEMVNRFHTGIERALEDR